jgi:hypothetical protein
VRVSRLLAALALAVVLTVAAVHARATADPAPSPAPCSAAGLARALDGTLKVTSVSAYGCESNWAYLWANVGSGASEVSVTELLRYSSSQGRWLVASRGQDCTAALLPAEIYRRACFSN